jgi:carboxypeptidase C (cathepsin A)
LIVLSGIYAWSQGGRRGAQAQQAQTPAAQPPAAQPTQQAPAGRGGRGAAAPAPATSEFYNYDPTASTGQQIQDAPPAESHQKVTAGGGSIDYTARAGFMPIRNATTGAAEAHIFYTSYLKDGGEGRPVVFFFGGAPGVSAAWQDFGGFGPKIRATGGAQPWANNPNTLLGSADLVFANPVGTGFSRPDSPGHAAAFWSPAADAASLAEFVRAFVARNNRFTSPLYLGAEDQSTGRAAALAAYLHEHDVAVQGVILLSMTLSADAEAGDTQYLTLLPSLTMAAWQHKKLPPEMNAMSAEQVSGMARQFASRELLHALYKGDRMTAEERNKALTDLGRFTGLPRQFLISNDLRVTLERFNAELMRDQHHTLSPTDARVAGFTPPAVAAGRGGGGFGGGAAQAIDFNLSNLATGFGAAYQAYVRGELSFNPPGNELFYLSSGGVGTFTGAGSDEASLSAAFARNPNLRLFLAVNYFDLTNPFYATEYTLAHLNVSPEVRAHNITVNHYEAGAMPYLDAKSAGKLQKDLSAFIGAK